MGFIRQRITIVHLRRPKQSSINDELQWFGHALGMFGERDRDKSCFRLFIELLKSAKIGDNLSSDELAARTALSRGTVVHHINRLMENGVVVQTGKKYGLRDKNLQFLLQDLRKDIEDACKEIETAAKEIDELLEI